MRNRLSVLGFAIIASSLGPAIYAQQSTSTLKGRVSTPNGDPKVGVLVTVINTSTQLTRTQRTGGSGMFVFFALPVGKYEITFSADGQTYKQTRSALLGQMVDVSFKWPTVASATVEIVGNASLAQTVDTTSAQVGTSVTAETLDDLPVVSRDINYAAILAPGVAMVTGSNVDPTKKTSSYIQTGEGQGRGTNFALDGGDNNSTDVGGYVLAVPYDAVAELQVVTNQYKAEFGKSTSGFFNVLTKSGGNEFSGIVSTQYQNQTMRAKSTDEGDIKDSSKGIYGFTVLGPILKDRLFYMVSVEQTKGVDSAYTFQPYALSVDPSLGGVKYNLTRKNIYAKLDWLPTPDFTTSFTYGYYQDETANQAFPRTQTFHGNVLATALGTGHNQTSKMGLKVTWVITPNLNWESNLNSFDYKNGISPHDLGPFGGAPTAVRDVSGSIFTRTDTFDLGWAGLDPNSVQNTGIKRTQWKNEVSYTVETNSFKAGFEVQRTTYADQQLFFNETGVYTMRVVGPVNGGVPSVTYANAITNQTLDPDVNVVGAQFVANGFQSGVTFNTYGLYLQDDWTIDPKFILYAGIRMDWDTQLEYLKKYDSMYAAIRTNTRNWSNKDAGHQYADPVWNSGQAPRDKTYYSPRLQGIFRPEANDKFALKVGFGSFVAQTIDNVVGFSRALGDRANGLTPAIWNTPALNASGYNPPFGGPNVASFKQGSTLFVVNGHAVVLPADLTPYNLAHNVNGIRDYFRNNVDGWLTTATADTNGKALMASDFQYPTTLTYSIGAAYRFSAQQAIEADLVYSKSKHLTVQSNGGNGLDASGPQATEYDSSGIPINDNVFYSNQTATDIQLQVKYTYSTSHTSFLATLAIKDMKSSNGGSIGSFDNTGLTDFYGQNALYSWKTSPERRSPGSERFSGSFNVSHRFDFGTMLSFLGQWHSGKAYDVTWPFPEDQDPKDPNAPGASMYDPNPIRGYREGNWALNLDLRVAQKITIGHKLVIEPFITIQNILNNYDYAANYNGQERLADGEPNPGTPGKHDGFGERGPSWQYNIPRTGVVGVRITF